jgi:dTDP-4-amino-4,6-dideoxygalactose transaminase
LGIHLKHWTLDNRIILPDREGHAFMMYPIILNESINTTNVIGYLNKHGIEVRRMMPITNQPVVQDYLTFDLAKEYPIADFINRQGFYVGCHPELSITDTEEMSKIISAAIKEEVERVNI